MTDSTKCTAREKKEIILWKVGGAETWFGGERDPGCCRGEGVLITERGQRERSEHTGHHSRKTLS